MLDRTHMVAALVVAAVAAAPDAAEAHRRYRGHWGYPSFHFGYAPGFYPSFGIGYRF